MKNGFVLILSLSVMALSIAYYFGFYLPAKNTTEALFLRKQQCQEIGSKYFLQEAEVKNYSDGDFSSMTGNGEYTYSKELNTCLYANRVFTVSSDTTKTESFIIDLATNNKLASWIVWDKGCDDCGMNPVSIDNQARYQELYDKNFTSK